MLRALQVRIADRLAALEDAGPDQPALPAPAPAPQQVGFLPTVEGGKWALQALPQGARAPPPGSVWAYLPTSTPGQTGGPCLRCCLAAAWTKQLAVLVKSRDAAAHQTCSSVMRGCEALPVCQRLVSSGADTLPCLLSFCLLFNAGMAYEGYSNVLSQAKQLCLEPVAMPCNAASAWSTIICVRCCYNLTIDLGSMHAYSRIP